MPSAAPEAGSDWRCTTSRRTSERVVPVCPNFFRFCVTTNGHRRSTFGGRRRGRTMGKHAAPRATSMKARQISRAAGVSAGTLLLCLGAAAPAIAGTSPVPSPVSDVPTPPIPQPVSDTVQQVSDIVGVPNPLAAKATPSHHHHHHAKPSPVTQPTISLHHHSGTPSTASRGTTHGAGTPAYVPTSYYGGGLLRPNAMQGPAVLTGRAPAIADRPTVTRIVQAAGSHAIHALPSTATPEDAARLAVLAIATMLLGGLASGHMKLAQQRLTGW